MPILGVIASSKPGGLSGYVSLATYTATGGESAITFNSISQSYQHLEVRWIGRSQSASTGWQWLWTRFNGDTSSTYSYMNYYGAQPSALAANGGTTGVSYMYSGIVVENGQSANLFSGGYIRIPNYSGTTQTKGLRAQSGWSGGGDTGVVANLVGGYFNGGTAAVTSLSFTPQSSNWAAGSTFALYGIK